MDLREGEGNQWVYSNRRFLHVVCDVLRSGPQGRPEGQGPPGQAGA